MCGLITPRSKAKALTRTSRDWSGAPKKSRGCNTSFAVLHTRFCNGRTQRCRQDGCAVIVEMPCRKSLPFGGFSSLTVSHKHSARCWYRTWHRRLLRMVTRSSTWTGAKASRRNSSPDSDHQVTHQPSESRIAPVTVAGDDRYRCRPCAGGSIAAPSAFIQELMKQLDKTTWSQGCCICADTRRPSRPSPPLNQLTPRHQRFSCCRGGACGCAAAAECRNFIPHWADGTHTAVASRHSSPTRFRNLEHLCLFPNGRHSVALRLRRLEVGRLSPSL